MSIVSTAAVSTRAVDAYMRTCILREKPIHIFLPHIIRHGKDVFSWGFRQLVNEKKIYVRLLWSGGDNTKAMFFGEPVKILDGWAEWLTSVRYRPHNVDDLLQYLTRLHNSGHGNSLTGMSRYDGCNTNIGSPCSLEFIFNTDEYIFKEVMSGHIAVYKKAYYNKG